MKEFGYDLAVDVDSALATVSKADNAAYLAGGTNLVDLMKLGVETPAMLVDVNELPLGEIQDRPDGTVHVGATVTNNRLAVHMPVRRRFPVLSQAILSGASGQLRNLATVGGNLLQRNRCGYFTDIDKRCNKREPGTGCAAVNGLHANHAILGATDSCVAVHPSDMAVALAALDAIVQFRHSGGDEEVPVTEFYRPVGDSPHLETVMPRGSLITGIVIPELPAKVQSRYRKVRDRASYAFAICSIAAVLHIEDGVIRDVRIALGAVASHPWRARIAEQALIGKAPTEDEFAAAADAELAHAKPLPHNGYKVGLSRNLIVRMLTELTEAQS